MTGPRWHRLDPTDAYFAYDSELVFAGVDVPGVGAVRQALAEFARHSPQVFRATDPVSGRWRRFSEQELRLAPELLVTGSDADPWAALDGLTRTGLDGVGFRVVVGAGWAGLKASHAALFDGTSIYLFMAALLDPRRPPAPVRVVPGWQRDAMLAGYLTRHPWALRAASGYQVRRTAVPFVPPGPRPLDAHVLSHAHSEPGAASALRALRDRYFPGSSLGAVLLAGVRTALARAGVVPQPGAEVLFDVRRYFPSARPLFGNWATGMHLRADDDYSPPSVTAAVQDASATGLPVAAMAAGRVLGRWHRRAVLDRPVPAPRELARLSFSYLGGHSPVSGLPWRGDGPAYVLHRTRPASAEALTVQVTEVAGRLSVSVNHHESVWPRASVQSAAQELLRDPFGVLVGGPAADEDGREDGAEDRVLL